MSNEKPKKPWQSGGIVTGFITLLLAVFEWQGVFIDDSLKQVLTDPETIEKITQAETYRALGLAAIGLAVIYFRLRATRAIAGGVEGVKDAVTKPIRWLSGLFTKKKQE